MADASALDELVRKFLAYELPEITEFRQARQQFRNDLPAVLDSLRETIVEAESSNKEFKQAAQTFLNCATSQSAPT